MTSPFHQCQPADIRDLVAAYPLAWVHSVHAGEASLLPLVGKFDADGNLAELIGHFARTNPLREALQINPQATILFTGPQGYISPSHAGRRDWGPTWNYAQLHVDAEISVEEDLTARAIDLLVDHVEKGRADPWSASELGERYGQLIPMIVGFRAKIRRVRPVFKLGQTEDAPTFQAILSNLPEGELKEWMKRFDQRVREDMDHARGT